MKHYKVHYKRWLEATCLLEDLKTELLGVHEEKEIEDRFYRYLDFGTAGLRGLIGAGTNRMNVYTIRRASYGFAQYLLANHPKAKKRGIAIAYDSRQMSGAFAKEAAAQFAYFGIKVYLFPELKPTPMLSFAVRKLQAAGGIVITASHNPSEYNGYKVYDEYGCQISLSAAECILHFMNKVEDELCLPSLEYESAHASGLIEYISSELDDDYYQHVQALSINKDITLNKGEQIKIVYTPLHGTGHIPVKKILLNMGFKQLYMVSEQTDPDPFFTTVSAPNPEDPNAFKLATKLAREIQADLIIGTDPDADRLGVVIKTTNGEYQSLSGNQIGALLLHYILEQRQKHNQLPLNGVVFKSIVTSDIGRKICKDHGILMEETLTGFKFIGEKITQYEQSSKHTFLFGYEESYGFLIGDFVRDKDAIQTALLFAEMVLYYKEQERTLVDVLNLIYQRYGYYHEDQISITYKGKDGMEKIKTTMANLRKQPVTQIAGMNVTEVKDYLKGIDELPATDVYKLILSDESWIVFRPSGTEPKLKCYLSVVSETSEEGLKKITAIKEYLRRDILTNS